MYPLPRSVQTPESEVVVDGLPRWEVVGQESPGAAATEHVEDGVEDLTQIMEARTSVGFRSGEVGFQAAPFGIGEVGLISSSHARYPTERAPQDPFSDSFMALDFSQLAEKGVGYARHQSPLKEVSDAHPTHPDDTGFAPVRATVLEARLAARSGAPGWRDPRSGRKDRKFRPAHDGLGPREALPPLPSGA